jgi:hypothetical protein
VGFQEGCCALQNGSDRKSIPTAGEIREDPRPKAPRTQGGRPALLNDHSPGGHAQGKGRTHKKKRAPRYNSNYQLKGRKTLLCKASKVEIESTRQQGNPKIKTKEQRPNENKRRGLKNQPYCQQAHGVKIYAQGKTRTGIITRAQTQNNAQEKKGKPYCPKTPTRENSRNNRTLSYTIYKKKRTEDILKQYIEVHSTLLVPGSYLGQICLQR